MWNAPTPETAVEPHHRGTAGFNRLVVAMFAAGLATFTTLYCAQALLPAIAGDFHLTPAQVSLTVSVATAGLAIAVLPISALADAYGRVPVMTASLFVAALLGVASAASPTFEVLLVLRGLQGIALAGLQAAAMTYLAEEVHRGSLGLAMGLFIGGNGIGGMLGRVVAGVVLDFTDWRWSLATVGLLALVCAIGFRLLIPPARFFRQRAFRYRVVAGSLAKSLTDSGLVRLFVVGSLGMAVFVSVYNYLGFRLLAPPFALPPAIVGFVFVTYVAGAVASALAGRLADRFGRPRLLWMTAVVTLLGLVLMVPNLTVLIVVGLLVTTAGFFALHSVASGWVGARSKALGAQGPAMYLLFYYFGSSVGGWLGGLAFGHDNWLALTALLVTFLLTVLGLAASVRRLRPAQPAESPDQNRTDANVPTWVKPHRA